MNPKDILKKTNDAIAKIAEERRQKQLEGDRKDLVNQINATIGPLLMPYLSQMVENTKMHKGEMQEMMAAVMSDLRAGIKDSLSNLKIDGISADIKIPEINIPEIKVPEVKVPAPQVTVNFDTSKIRIAPPVMPAEMKVTGEVSLKGVDLRHPLPVQLRDEEGKIVKLFENLTTLIGGGSGGQGKSDFFTIKAFMQSAFSVPVNADGQVPVSGSFTASAAASTYVIPGNAEGVIYNSDNPLPVTITSGASATSAANIVDSSGVAYSGSNPVPVVITSGASATSASNIVDSSGVAYSGSNPVPVITQPLNAFGADGLSNEVVRTGLGLSNGSTWDRARNTSGEGNALRIQMATDSVASVYITGASSSLAANIVDSSGIAYSGSNPVPMTLAVSNASSTMNAVLVDSGGVGFNGTNPVPVRMVSGSFGTVGSNIVNSSGIAYSGSNPVPITGNVNVNGSLNSTINVGPVVADAIDDGSAPVQMGGMARTANPTAVAGGDVVKFSADKLGRQLNRPVQVRDLITTAYVSVANGTETTFKAASAGEFLDLVYIMGSNSSDAAVIVDIRAVTAGNILMSLAIPANGTAGVSLSVPFPQSEGGNNWTADLPDITGTTVYLSGLFSREV